MKKIRIIIGLLTWMAWPSGAATATFNYTYTTSACPMAPSAPVLAKSCLTGFGIGTVAGGVFTQIATCPLSPVTTGTVTGVTCQFTGAAPLGNVTFAVVALYLDATGTAGQSPLIPVGSPGSNETSVIVSPTSPSGVVIIFP